MDHKFNRFAQMLTGNCLVGISIAWLKRNHTAHHIAVNSLEYNPDLQHMSGTIGSTAYIGEPSGNDCEMTVGPPKMAALHARDLTKPKPSSNLVKIAHLSLQIRGLVGDWWGMVVMLIRVCGIDVGGVDMGPKLKFTFFDRLVYNTLPRKKLDKELPTADAQQL
ncbi:hypothetical protein L2E82_19949 [Cichorium intybus]|uniref:Uncharacterized protein n=1 Tax=Cichorium intybus TaxID=13427 RepID=A0ACB9DRY9_CICIN|nr:hypothetical protein L2E82_19949 [Cichorium intybus]